MGKRFLILVLLWSPVASWGGSWTTCIDRFSKSYYAFLVEFKEGQEDRFYQFVRDEAEELGLYWRDEEWQDLDGDLASDDQLGELEERINSNIKSFIESEIQASVEGVEGKFAKMESCVVRSFNFLEFRHYVRSGRQDLVLKRLVGGKEFRALKKRGEIEIIDRNGPLGPERAVQFKTAAPEKPKSKFELPDTFSLYFNSLGAGEPDIESWKKKWMQTPIMEFYRSSELPAL
ncbi:MAG: hypothetical protein KDD25_01825 [Bdellovibrionales bacterium]|nr:hypothetical protein [Bdellovibrionales bacterium]